MSERKVDKEAAIEEKENNKTSSEDAKKLAADARVKSSDEGTKVDAGAAKKTRKRVG